MSGVWDFKTAVFVKVFKVLWNIGFRVYDFKMLFLYLFFNIFNFIEIWWKLMQNTKFIKLWCSKLIVEPSHTITVASQFCNDNILYFWLIIQKKTLIRSTHAKFHWFWFWFFSRLASIYFESSFLVSIFHKKNCLPYPGGNCFEEKLQLKNCLQNDIREAPKIQ